MRYHWQFRPYRRRFKQALQTNHRIWTERDGVLLQLMDEAGNIGWGEVAPVPWFGSETIEQALEFCRHQPSQLSKTLIFSIPDTLPSCQFAFESAWDEIEAQRRYNLERLQHQGTKNQGSSTTLGSRLSTSDSPPLSYSALLPAGKTALHVWKPLWEQGFCTFKWKIGVYAIALELEILHSLTQTLPQTATLRLDANGGLGLDSALQWLQACDAIADNPNLPVIEYIEQPLPIAQFQAMEALSQQYRTPIALDESVATLHQLQACYEDGWRGIFVIKPAIVGSPSRLRQFCRTQAIDAVFSSSFETAIGRHAGIRLAKELGNLDRALGYGTAHWFDEAEFDNAETDGFEQLWLTL